MQVGPDDDNYSQLRSQPTYPVRFDHDHDDESDLCNGVDHHHDGDHCKGVTDSKLI